MPTARRSWIAVATAFGVNGTFIGVWAARIPAIREEFSLAHDELGLLLLVMAIGALLSFPIAGRVTDAMGAAPVTRALAFACAITVIGISLAPTIWLLPATGFFFGASFGAMDVAMNTWASEVDRRFHKDWMPSFHAMWSLGGGLGALSGTLAISAGVSYGWHFAMAAGVLAIVATIGTRVIWEKEPTTPHDGPLFPLPRGNLLLLGLMCLCSAIGEGAVADWSAVYLLEVGGATEQIAPIGLAAFSATMVAMRLMGSVIIRTLGAVPTAVTSGVFAAFGSALAVFFPVPWVAVLGFSMMGIGYALIWPLALSRAGASRTLPPAQAIASVATLGYGAVLLGPPIIGFVASFAGLRVAFGLLFVLAVAMISLAPALRAKPSDGSRQSSPT